VNGHAPFYHSRASRRQGGAVGLAAIYTGHGPDVFRLLRELEIRSESWLNYLYNPF
jgi:hypothetical protein